MSFQNKTLDIIKNFASINQGLVFKEGNQLKTCSVLRNIYAFAEVPDSFPRNFAIYDLNAFLSVLSLFEKPVIEFKETHILIASEKSKIKYFYSSPTVVVSPPDKEVKFVDKKLSFVLTDADWRQMQKASSVLRLTKFNVEEGRLNVTGEKDNSNTFDIAIETTGDGLNGENVFVKIENIKLLPGDYNVEVYTRALRFQSVEDPNLIYFVAVEAE